MAQDVLSIFNLAISSIGINGITLENTDANGNVTDEGTEADACRLWYDLARQQVLRAAHWPDARKIAALGTALAEREPTEDWADGDPLQNLTGGWQFAYTSPTDLLYPRRLTPVANRFVQGIHGDARVIFTDAETPVLEYTFDNKAPALWDTALYEAIVAALASMIVLPLTANLSYISLMQNRANGLILDARTDIANDQEERYESLPPWIEARLALSSPTASPSTAAPQYIYPFGPLIGATTHPGAETADQWRAFPEGNR